MSSAITYDWISIGGGAAGFYGALQFAEKLKERGQSSRVLILEASFEPLSKVKISGGGRCNITHHCFDPKKLATFYPRGSRELLSVFSRYQPQDVWTWFETHGVPLKIEKDGRIFPKSDSSRSVIDLFLSLAKRLNIEVLLKSPVMRISKDKDGLFLIRAAQAEFKTKNILVASGSSRKIWEMLSELGHQIQEPVPSLFSFNIQDQRLEGLSGRSFQDIEIECRVGSSKFRARGPLLITHWGLSGPAILKVSAWAARELAKADYKTLLRVNFLPEMSRQEMIEWFRKLRTHEASKRVKNLGVKGMNSDYWAKMMQARELDEQITWAELSNHQIEGLADEILRAEFRTEGKTTNKEEFVTAGGIHLKEVDFKTMMSKKISNLYLAGEVLDIDGITGGFNFQSAWSTSTIAAWSAAGPA